MKRSELVVVQEEILDTLEIRAFNINRGFDEVILKVVNNFLKDNKFTQTLDKLDNTKCGTYFTSEEKSGNYFKAYADNFGNIYVYIIRSAYAYIREF